MISGKDIALTKEDVSELLNAFGGNDDDSYGSKEATPTLSDEEIKLAILELTARNNCLTELSYDEFNRVKEIFQWVKGE